MWFHSLINKGTSGQKIADYHVVLSSTEVTASCFPSSRKGGPQFRCFFGAFIQQGTQGWTYLDVHQLTANMTLEKVPHFQYRKYTNTNAGCFIVSFRGTVSVLQLWWLDFQLPWPAILPPSFTFVAPRRVKLVRSLALKSEWNELQTKLEIQLKM